MLFSKMVKSVVICAGLTWVAFSEAPVARVIGDQPVDLDGIDVPARNFTPVKIGDEILTQSGSAIVQFRDGSNIVVQPKSKVRIEGQRATPRVRILEGSASPNIMPASKLKLVDSKGEVIIRVLSATMPDPAAMTRVDSPLTEGVVYRASVKNPGAAQPGAAISVGQFSGMGTFHATGSGTNAVIITPSGLTINLTAVTNPTTGQVTYTISSLSQTVTEPNGTQATIQVTTGTLVGATVGGISGSTTSGGSVTISITPAGSTTPLTPTQVGTAVQTSITQTIGTDITNGTLPSGTTPSTPTTGSILNGQFSNSAP